MRGGRSRRSAGSVPGSSFGRRPAAHRVVGRIDLAPATGTDPARNQGGPAQRRLLYLVDVHGGGAVREGRREGPSVGPLVGRDTLESPLAAASPVRGRRQLGRRRVRVPEVVHRGRSVRLRPRGDVHGGRPAHRAMGRDGVAPRGLLEREGLARHRAQRHRVPDPRSMRRGGVPASYRWDVLDVRRDPRWWQMEGASDTRPGGVTGRRARGCRVSPAGSLHRRRFLGVGRSRPQPGGVVGRQTVDDRANAGAGRFDVQRALGHRVSRSADVLRGRCI